MGRFHESAAGPAVNEFPTRPWKLHAKRGTFIIADAATGIPLITVSGGERIAEAIVGGHNAAIDVVPRPARGAHEQEQQVNVQATLVLSLPTSWSEEDIATHIRSCLGNAFRHDLPGEVDGESPVNFDFQEEAEIYGLNDDDTHLERLQRAIRPLTQRIRDAFRVIATLWPTGDDDAFPTETFRIDHAASSHEYLNVDVKDLGSVSIKAQPDGIVVDVFPLGGADNAVASTWAHINDLTPDEEETPRIGKGAY